MKNKELVKLRIDHDLTQKKAADLCGVSAAMYNLIENGKRRGSKEFWHNIQKIYDLDGGQVWQLQNPEI